MGWRGEEMARDEGPEEGRGGKTESGHKVATQVSLNFDGLTV